ncbi:MAG: hypothetical protein ACEQSL_08745 [Sediminibacterium sp.]
MNYVVGTTLLELRCSAAFVLRTFVALPHSLLCNIRPSDIRGFATFVALQHSPPAFVLCTLVAPPH